MDGMNETSNPIKKGYNIKYQKYQSNILYLEYS